MISVRNRWQANETSFMVCNDFQRPYASFCLNSILSTTAPAGPCHKQTLEDKRQSGLLKKAWADSGKVYGYRKLHDNLQDQALLMAVWRKRPTTKVLIHSDQGSQLTSIDCAWRRKISDILRAILRLSFSEYNSKINPRITSYIYREIFHIGGARVVPFAATSSNDLQSQYNS